MLDVATVWKHTRLVRKDDYVVFKNNEKITDLFPVTGNANLPLIAINTRITPEAKKCVLTQFLKVPLRRGGSISTHGFTLIMIALVVGHICLRIISVLISMRYFYANRKL
jgi:hypothetical protein